MKISRMQGIASPLGGCVVRQGIRMVATLDSARERRGSLRRKGEECSPSIPERGRRVVSTHVVWELSGESRTRPMWTPRCSSWPQHISLCGWHPTAMCCVVWWGWGDHPSGALFSACGPWRVLSGSYLLFTLS